MYSIIFGIIGAFILRGHMFMGIFLGLVVGGFLDAQVRARRSQQNGGQQQRSQRGIDDIFEFYRAQTQRYDFPTQLMALSAFVMKSDGRIVKSELNYVKEFFSRQFGPQFSNTHLQSLKRFIDSPTLPIEEICTDIRFRTPVEVRLQLLQYLFGIAQADGEVSQSEITAIQRVALYLQISEADFRSVQGFFKRNIEGDYEVLGISKDASDEEVKKAYRQMAVRFHPDKFASESEEVQKGAKEKFQKLQEAYDRIKKARGI